MERSMHSRGISVWPVDRFRRCGMSCKHAVAFAALVIVGACSETPSSPSARSMAGPSMQKGIGGSGLSVNVVPNVTLPLGLGGSITINQAVITNFALVENTVG